jgi:hypothetical protein
MHRASHESCAGSTVLSPIVEAMKRTAKLSLNRETLRILTLDGQLLRQVAGAILTATCLYSECGVGCTGLTRGNRLVTISKLNRHSRSVCDSPARPVAFG